MGTATVLLPKDIGERHYQQEILPKCFNNSSGYVDIGFPFHPLINELLQGQPLTNANNLGTFKPKFIRNRISRSLHSPSYLDTK